MQPDFAEERARLRSKCVYMADNDILQRVRWYTLQDFDRVVTVEEAERFEAEQAAAILSQEDPLEEPEVRPPRPAVLSAIVRLSRNKFFMSACGGWTPASITRAGVKFPECRASAFAEAPRNISDIAGVGDFEAGLKRLKELCEDRSPGSQPVGLMDDQSHQHPCFKIGHRIFERKSTDTRAINQLGNPFAVIDEEEEEDDDREFRIDGWPVRGEHAAVQQELNRLRDTHITRPIPAYNIAGKRIRPSRYVAELRGAVVRLEFYLLHRVINARHVFTADVKRMRVLVPAPPSDTPTPKRKRVAKYDDFDNDDDDETNFPPSPTKKPKCLK